MPKSPCGEELVPYIQNEGKVTGRWGQMESDLYACSKCGYQVFLPLPSNEQLGHYYGSQYWELSGSIEEAKQAYNGGYYSDAAHELMNIWQSHGTDANVRIHEIGCGYGAAVHFLNKLGADATGSDLSDSAPEVAKSLGNNKTVSMQLDDYLKSNPKHGINYFYMSHSLEHIPEPSATVKSVYNALNTGGLYVIRVPNGMHITSRLRSEYESTWLQYPDHIHYFTPKSAICLLEKQGFEIVEITTRLREDHPDQMVTASLGLSFKQLPDYISYLKGLCDNWLGMELQIIARKPQKGTKLVSDDLVAKANAFENGAKDLEVAKILPSQNSVEFNSIKNDEFSWKYFEKIASSLVDFKKHEDGKKFYTENGL